MSQVMRNSRLLAISIVTAIAVAALVLLAITGTLSAPRFAIGCVGVIGVSAVIWFILLKRGGADSFKTNGVSKAQNGNRAKYVRVAILLLLLIAGFLITRGGPWIPRLLGASVLMLFWIGTIVRKTQT